MTIRWGIIGCGDVCEVKSGPALQKADGSELVAVMRRDAAKAEDFAKRHGVPRWTTDADAVIRDPDVDIVYIATPPDTHCGYALQVAAAGKPCYVEKPMARHHAECVRMAEAFDRAGRPLFVAYYRRRLPRFVKARQLIDDGAVGEVTSVLYRQSNPGHLRDYGVDVMWRLRAEVSGAGLFLDLGSHTLDLLDYLLGPIVQVGGAAANRATPIDVEDNVVMHFVHESGVLGNAAWNFASTVNEDLLEIRGAGGRITLSVFGDDDVVLVNADGEQRFDGRKPAHVHQPLVQTIVDELSGKSGRCPSTGVTAARTSKVMDDVLSGYYGGRDDAFWARPQTWPGRRVSRK